MSHKRNNHNMPENPVDPEKTSEQPGLLPYAHHVGSALIRPIDKGKVKGLAVSAMYEQANMQMANIRKQIDLLAEQARSIQKRVELSEEIYQAEMNFKPLIGHTYHLYQRENGAFVLSMVAPQEWGRKKPFTFKASVKLLSDHTWQMIDEPIK